MSKKYVMCDIYFRKCKQVKKKEASICGITVPMQNIKLYFAIYALLHRKGMKPLHCVPLIVSF